MTTSVNRSAQAEETVISRHLTSEGTVVWTRDTEGRPRMTLYPHSPGARPRTTIAGGTARDGGRLR
ncbi:hypothetical protein SUDANB171_00727 [Streptomyces sp. enrichment culture]|uniref:hypothetical protein n=1 Tax=Streptomyces xiamenensis TaxID=408015 RepID=UPI0036E260B0